MYTLQDLKKTHKPIAAVAERMFDPLSEPLALFFANFTSITPNMITLMSAIAGVISGYVFYLGHIYWGIFFYALAFLLDMTDGKVARLKYKPTQLGLFWEVNSDKLRIILPLMGLTYAYFNVTGDTSIFYWGMGFLFTNLFFPFEEAHLLYQSMKKGHAAANIAMSGAAGGRLAKIRGFLHKKRTDLMYTAMDQEHIPFLFFPLLTYFSIAFVKWGFIVATLSYLLWVLLVKYPRQIKRLISQ